MKLFCVTFTNNFGKLSILVPATTQEEAIKDAIASDYVASYSSVEASMIMAKFEKAEGIHVPIINKQ